MFIFYWVKKILKPIAAVFIVIGVLVTIINAFFYLTADTKVTLFNPKTQTESPFKAVHDAIDMTDISDKEKVRQKEIFNSIACKATGKECGKDISADQAMQNSFVGSLSGLISLPYQQPPASGVSYLAYKLQNNGFIPSTYAYEGVGLASIRGYFAVWEIFRNFSYLVLVLFIVVIGFMIMFRVELGGHGHGQTVASIESALPRIVITLILITLSFPIAGFMIDLMYAMIGLFVFLLSSTFDSFSSVKFDQIDLVNKYIGADLAQLWPLQDPAGPIDPPLTPNAGSALQVGTAFYNVMPLMVKVGLDTTLGAFITAGLVKLYIWKFVPLAETTDNVSGMAATFGASLGKIPGGLITFLLTTIVSAVVSHFFNVVGFLLTIGIMLTLVLFMFRIFFMLLSSYIKVILFTMFSPLILLFHVMPGKNAFGWWIRALFGELLTFVIVVVVVLTGYIIVGINESQDMIFKLPFLNNGFSAKDFGSIIGLGIVLMIPQLVKLIKAMLGIQELGLNMGAGMFFEGVTGAVGGAQQGLGTFSSLQTLGHNPLFHNFVEKSPMLKAISGPTQQQMFENVMRNTSVWKEPTTHKSPHG